MPRRTPLGKLFIAWGPEAFADGPADDVFRDPPDRLVHVFLHFHAHAYDDNPDPFHSQFFGKAVKALVAGEPVVLKDRVFDDPGRRMTLERAFRRVFPDLVVEHVLLGAPDSGEVPAEQGIVIDRDVYAEGDEGSNESICVESDAPVDVVAAALGSAAERMMRVGEDGHEYADVDEVLAVAGEVYTPNYVSEVRPDEDGNPGFYIDCKGGIEPRMAARFREILVEELTQQGVRSARIRVPGSEADLA